MNPASWLSDLLARNAAAAASRGPSIPEMWAAAPADAPCLILPDRSLSYGEIDAAARRAASGLAALGVVEGDRVACWLPNLPEYLVTFLACCRLGAVCVAVNTRYRSVEVGDIVGRSGAKALVLAPGFRGIDFAGILADVDPADVPALEALVTVGEVPAPVLLGAAKVVPWAQIDAAPPMAESRGGPEKPCKVFTTSGTTSGPKFVLHAQATLARHGRDAGAGMGLEAPDAVLLQAIPFCGVFGMAQILAAAAWARPSVLPPAFDAAQAVALMAEHRVTHANGGDDMLDRLMSVSGGALNPEFRHFGYARFNPALDDVAERANAAGISCVGLYGMSECMALFSFQPADCAMERRKMGGGVPVSAEAGVRVRDPESGAILPPGDGAGELEVTGPSIMLGYLFNDEATRKTFTDDGWLKTGDLAQATADGGFVFLNRMGDALRLGGFLTDPREIETHLMTHADVEACQVVGVQAGGKPRAAAFVIPRAGAAIDEAALAAHCDGRLAKFKVPARVFVVDRFPTTPSANGEKIQRNRLREMAQQAIDAAADERNPVT
ncbi:AMP-binding protein [Albimonas sp. CAU 1670]|uniref:AMP-binding protein n=1 Tax=Albimonas sp. CAU 1670 TaxID=3032599 RepID=UPI0023D9EF02|nr:AMP-binding protein [Albimonas sp. CAU 1670]MDF2234588.1 AMP-binding protein [Albimonas sp. CAU 1670]